LQLPPTLAAFSPRATILLELTGVEGRLMACGRGVVPLLDVIVTGRGLFDTLYQVRHKLRRRGLR
jgi:hypothetical protein